MKTVENITLESIDKSTPEGQQTKYKNEKSKV